MLLWREEGGSRPVTARRAAGTLINVKPKKMRQPRQFKEEAEAEKLMQLLYFKLPKIADLIYHTPNGGKRNKFEALRLKKQGTKAGIPDYFLPVAIAPFHGLYLELKAQKGTLQKSQKEWLNKLSEQGYATCVAYGADQAFDQITKYLQY